MFCNDLRVGIPSRIDSDSSSASTSSSTNSNSSSVTTCSSSSPKTSHTVAGQSSTVSSQHQNQQSKEEQQSSLSSDKQQQVTKPYNATTSAYPPSPVPALQPPSFFTNWSNPLSVTIPQTRPAKPVKQDLHVQPQPSPKIKTMAVNFKQILHTHSQRSHTPLVYECMASEDSVGYIATVKVSGKVFKSSPHGTKRAAETAAAEEAVMALGLLSGSHGAVGEQHHQHGRPGFNGGYAQMFSQPQGASILNLQ